jgi:putative copper export protein
MLKLSDWPPTQNGGTNHVSQNEWIPEALGNVQLCPDVLHLSAAGEWLGGLVPLLLFFRQKSQMGGGPNR